MSLKKKVKEVKKEDSLTTSKKDVLKICEVCGQRLKIWM